MTSWRRWALSRAPPPLRGQAPQPVSTDPDSASTQPARPSILPSSAPPCRGLCREAPLCSPPVRDHTPWISLRCAPVWSPRWHAETCCNPWTSVRPGVNPRWGSRSLEPLPLSVSFFISASLKGRTRGDVGGLQMKGTRRGSPSFHPWKDWFKDSFLLLEHSNGQNWSRVSFL